MSFSMLILCTQEMVDFGKMIISYETPSQSAQTHSHHIMSCRSSRKNLEEELMKVNNQIAELNSEAKVTAVQQQEIFFSLLSNNYHYMTDDSVLYFIKPNITLSKGCSTDRTFEVTLSKFPQARAMFLGFSLRKCWIIIFLGTII